MSKAEVIVNGITGTEGYIVEITGKNTHAYYRENDELKVWSNGGVFKKCTLSNDEDHEEFLRAREVAKQINEGIITEFNKQVPE